jgi:hypothetical protein
MTGCIVETGPLTETPGGYEPSYSKASTPATTPESTPTATPEATPTATPEATPTATPEATPTATPEKDLSNPYGTYEILVAYENPGSTPPSDFTYEGIIEDSIAYWNSVKSTLPYPFLLKYTEERSDAHILIQFQNPSVCGDVYGQELIGCAQVIHAGSQQPSFPVKLQVSDRFQKNYTFEITRHELGHTMGLKHSSDIAYLYQYENANNELIQVMKPTLQSELGDLRIGVWGGDYNWNITDFNVYLDYGEFYKDTHNRIKRQVEYALRYWELDPHNYLSRQVSFKLSDNPNSEITIKFADATDCPEGEDLFCGEFTGNDYDGDGVYDQYYQLRLQIPSKTVEYFSWLVGYGIAQTFRVDSNANIDLPSPFRKPHTESQWTNWWKAYQY